MQLRDLHIIIYSSLESTAGGRETWLNMFLPELYLQTNETCKITVYYFVRNKNLKLIDVVHDNRFTFKGIETPFGSSLGGHFRCLIKFVFVTVKLLLYNTDHNSLILSIGNFYDAFPGFFVNKLRSPKNRSYSIIWLRTIWEYQMKVLKTNRISKLILKLEKRILKQSTLVIANGWDTAKYYEEHIGLKAVTIPNAIQLERFSNITPLNGHNERIKISFIGRLGAEKGIISFLEAVKEFNSKYPSFCNHIHFEVVGDGVYREKVANFSSTNFSYMGALPNGEIPAYLETIHASVALTSSIGKEGGGGGISNQLLELLAAGRLIIAWDSFTFRQIINESSAIFIREGDVKELANCFKLLAEGFSNYIKRAQNARVIAKRFSIQKHVDEFLTAIKEIDQ